MASTRNKNTLGDYNLQQRQYHKMAEYELYTNSQYGVAYSTKNPGNGLLPGQIAGSKLSHNSADIESFLFGINSTNLVEPAPCLVPELIRLPEVNIYEKKPTLIPKPFVIEKKQRPLPIP
jgi:hypothetical protein